jgi:hypothetical protein
MIRAVRGSPKQEPGRARRESEARPNCSRDARWTHRQDACATHTVSGPAAPESDALPPGLDSALMERNLGSMQSVASDANSLTRQRPIQKRGCELADYI